VSLLIEGIILELSDQVLVRESRSGATVAFERLMARHERGVFHIAFSYTGDRESALDVTQNVFLKVHRKLDLLKEESQFKTWLFRIAVNESINWLRSQKRHLGHEELMEEALVEPGPAQDDLVERVEKRELLKRGLTYLGPRHRLAVVLRYFDEMSIREIAHCLQCSQGMVKNILFRSLRKMRARLSIRAEVTP